MNLHSHKQTGFTLIEMIVSLAVFSIVITVSVGALLMLIATNGQLQKEQSVMTNLSFAIDSMTREIRTGTFYFCESRANYTAGGPNNIFRDRSIGGLGPTNPDVLLLGRTQNCPDGVTSSHTLQGVAFIESGNSITGSTAERILYFYDQVEQKLYRRVGNGPAQSIVSSGIRIIDAEFFVTGSDPLAGTNDHVQPTVTIFIEATDDGDANKPYRIQTMVTQRTLDL